MNHFSIELVTVVSLNLVGALLGATYYKGFKGKISHKLSGLFFINESKIMPGLFSFFSALLLCLLSRYLLPRGEAYLSLCWIVGLSLLFGATVSPFIKRSGSRYAVIIGLTLGIYGGLFWPALLGFFLVYFSYGIINKEGIRAVFASFVVAQTVLFSMLPVGKEMIPVFIIFVFVVIQHEGLISKSIASTLENEKIQT